MIAFIKGKVIRHNTDSVILENHGIGYQVFMSNPMNLKADEEVLIHIYEHLREDAHILFGFSTIAEHDLFIRLISVKGIGPKTAINALSVGGSNRIIEAIETNDATYLKTLPGIGNKAASQIVLDLKGKLIDSKDVATIKTNVQLNDAMEALKALGYKPVEINRVIKTLSKEPQKSVDEYVKIALSLLIKNKGV